jgi:hypothetical protein
MKIVEEKQDSNQTRLLEAMKELPTLSAEAVEDRVELAGQSITRASLLSMVQNPLEQFSASIIGLQSEVQGLRNQQNFTQAAGPDSTESGSGFQRITHPFRWGEGNRARSHPIPHNYKFNIYNALTHWNMWHYGDKANHSGPHKLIRSELDLYSFPIYEKVKFSKICKVINEILAYIPLEYKPITLPSSDAAFDVGIKRLLQTLYPQIPPRHGDLTLTTLYEKLRIYNKLNK